MRLGKASPEGHAATWRAPLDIFFVLLVLFLMFWVAPPQARGQSTFGSISGVVTDPSNAVIPGVNVTLTNLGTNGKSESATNSVGAFQFVNLLPGEYRIDVEMQGFQHFTRTPVVVMGIVVIGGLFFSLVLTLFVIPAMYTFFSKEKKAEMALVDTHSVPGNGEESDVKMALGEKG